MALTSVQTTWILWSLGLALALTMQALLNRRVDGAVTYYTTTYLIVILVGFLYMGRVFPRGYVMRLLDGCWCNKPQQRRQAETETDEEEVNSPAAQRQQQQPVERTTAGGAPHPPQQQHCPTRRRRLHYLDAVKIFLTMLVVTHHVGCAFGGCGPGSWYLTIGLYDCTFNTVCLLFSSLNQSYFMTLFFFISAYLNPLSYDKKGDELFLYDKAKRLWIPTLVSFFTLIPFTVMISEALSGVSKVKYMPALGPMWFVLWLLVFHYVYATIRRAGEKDAATTTAAAAAEQEANNNGEVEATVAAPLVAATGDGQEHALSAEAVDERRVGNKADEATTTESAASDDHLVLTSDRVEQGSTASQESPTTTTTNSSTTPLPSPLIRYGVGIFICGLAMLGIYMAVSPTFFTMPITLGSLMNDLVFFGAGILAFRHRWLDDLSAKMYSFAGHTVVLTLEVVAFVILMLVTDQDQRYGILLYAVAGVYNVDVNLWLLRVAEMWFDRPFQWFAQATYTVYIIHPIIIVPLTGAYIAVYNRMYGSEQPILYWPETTMSSTPLVGAGNGSLALFVGWVVVGFLSHLIVWPLASFLRTLPGLKQVL